MFYIQTPQNRTPREKNSAKKIAPAQKKFSDKKRTLHEKNSENKIVSRDKQI